MEFEAWWLIALPIFFGLGWLASAANNKKQMEQTRQLPKAYFKGLNFLLDEEPDKAIDALIDVARVDTGTVDLYFSLGHLFAQRGEIARAIRVYQSLLERADLPEGARQNALHKLGLVFLQGGLFDRAEECFKLLRDTDWHEVALQQLLLIYQSQQEWQQAIEVAEQMVRTPESELALTHFHCERASIGITQKDFTLAEREIGTALALRSQSIRALLLKARWYSSQDRHTEAVAQLKQLASEQPAATPLLVSDIMNVYEALGEPATGLQYLHDQALNTGSVDVLNAWLTAQEKHGDASTTMQQLYPVFTKHPSLNALDKVLKQRLLITTDEPVQQELKAIEGLIKKQVLQFSRYRCASCGFEAARYYWQCPACTRWESYPPKRLEELEQAKHSRAQVNGY
jgi:lipopolysaccharide biosynthesis regulator YciM